MLMLAIDTSTSSGSAALLVEGRVAVERFFDMDRQHSKRLMVEVDEALRSADRTAAELDAVAVTIGPGSFTGLRIGLSAAKGLCFAGDAALILVSTLEAAAARLPYCADPVCVVLEARRSEVYAGLYDTSLGYPRKLWGPDALAPEELVERLADCEGVALTGGGATVHAALLGKHPGARMAPPHCLGPTAGAAGWLATRKLAAGETVDPASAEPEYVRQPDYAAMPHAQRPG